MCEGLLVIVMTEALFFCTNNINYIIMNKNKIVIEKKCESYAEAVEEVTHFLKNDLAFKNVFCLESEEKDWCIQKTKQTPGYMNVHGITQTPWLDFYVGNENKYFGIRVYKSQFADIKETFCWIE